MRRLVWYLEDFLGVIHFASFEWSDAHDRKGEDDLLEGCLLYLVPGQTFRLGRDTFLVAADGQSLTRATAAAVA